MASIGSDIRDRLEAIDTLPSLSPVFASLQHKLMDPTTDAKDLAEIIERDPGLTVKVIRVANSALFNPAGKPTSSLSQAVARLGVREIHKISTTVCAVGAFKDIPSSIDFRSFWTHSITAAAAMRVLADVTPVEHLFSLDDAYLAGLLHDVGAFILANNFPFLSRRVDVLAEERGATRAESERMVLGMDHAEVGGWLLRRWEFSEPVIEAVTWHHQPSRANPEHSSLVAAVHFADFVCTYLGIGEGGEHHTQGFCESCWDTLGFQLEHVPRIIAETEARVKDTEELLSLL